MDRCPTEQALRGLLADVPGTADAAAVEAHLETCLACQQVLERLTAEPLQYAARPSAAGTPQADATFLDRLERLAAGSTVPGRPAAASCPHDPESGELPRLAGYEVIGVLGRGGMGVVYQAWRTELKRLVAIKMILGGGTADAAERGRFRVEAEASARLQHPNIVQIHEVGTHDGRPYLVLEFVDGGNLARELDGGPVDARTAARLVETLARAMHYAHQRGIIHRDLKPSNILLAVAAASTLPRPAARLDGCIPKITDFGLAKLTAGGADQTHSGAILGTPSYMAPEQAGGRTSDISTAVDVHSLGAILYELLTGRPPFQGETVAQTLQQVLSEPAVAPHHLRPGLPRDLTTICLKCLEKDPRQRYASALDLAEDLRCFLVGEPIRARPAPTWLRAAKWARGGPQPPPS